MEMPKVSRCQVRECAYNIDEECHALAITVGDKAHPKCDTFLKSSRKGGDESQTAGVGACKVASCMHNDMFECKATKIDVGYKGDEIDCLTFKAR